MVFVCVCGGVGGGGKLGLAAEFSDTCFVSSVRRDSRFSKSNHWKKITNGKFIHGRRGVLVLLKLSSRGSTHAPRLFRTPALLCACLASVRWLLLKAGTKTRRSFVPDGPSLRSSLLSGVKVSFFFFPTKRFALPFNAVLLLRL